MTNSNITTSTARENKTGIDISGYRDSCRLYFEFFKHLTTLSTGSILLMVTFLTKALGGIEPNQFVLTSLSLFFLSVIASAACMFVVASHIQGKMGQQTLNQNLIALGTVIAAGTFLGGIGSFVLYAYQSMS